MDMIAHFLIVCIIVVAVGVFIGMILREQNINYYETIEEDENNKEQDLDGLVHSECNHILNPLYYYYDDDWGFTGDKVFTINGETMHLQYCKKCGQVFVNMEMLNNED